MQVFYGKPRSDQFGPRLLPTEMWRYHAYDAPVSQARATNDQIVFWSDGARVYEGAPAGTHDGLRDGEQSGHADWSGVRVKYALLSEWLAAGHPRLAGEAP